MQRDHMTYGIVCKHPQALQPDCRTGMSIKKSFYKSIVTENEFRVDFLMRSRGLSELVIN